MAHVIFTKLVMVVHFKQNSNEGGWVKRAWLKLATFMVACAALVVSANLVMVIHFKQNSKEGD